LRIEDFNGLPADDAAALIRACADIDAWVDAIVARRPYADVNALVLTAQQLSERWTDADVDQALSHHPRIGERATGPGASASAREQAGVDPADAALAEELRAGNAAYEEKFGRIYLVRARGRSGPELLSLLQERLTHDPATEHRVVVGELREIAVLRVKELFA